MGTETNKFGQEPTSLDKDQHVWNTGNGVRGREGCQREGRGGAKPTTNQRSTTTLRNNQSERDYNITCEYRALWELCDSIYHPSRCSKMNTTDL
uniref:Uncharacterized protein n=1 Tax=Timema genevievae TaxID=629358 RepID=A0A7R9K653_TIMGE|nr:unnamed protein product [Timema genevievae]